MATRAVLFFLAILFATDAAAQSAAQPWRFLPADYVVFVRPGLPVAGIRKLDVLFVFASSETTPEWGIAPMSFDCSNRLVRSDGGSYHYRSGLSGAWATTDWLPLASTSALNNSLWRAACSTEYRPHLQEFADHGEAIRAYRAGEVRPIAQTSASTQSGPRSALTGSDSSAPAQNSIRQNQTFTGQLTNSDARRGASFDNEVYECIDFQMQFGRRYAISFSSSAFEPVIEINRGSGCADFGYLGILYWAKGRDNRVDITPESTGSYSVLVSSRPNMDGSQGRGIYTLTLTDRGVRPSPPPPTPIGLGQSFTGAVAETDVEALAPGDDSVSFYDCYVFRPATNGRVVARLQSDTLSTNLRLHSGQTCDGDQVAEDTGDRGGGFKNSALSFDAERGQAYALAASSVSSFGPYALSLSAAPSGRTPPQSVNVGQTVMGRLSSGDMQTEDLSFFDCYRVDASVPVRVEMSSEVIDRVLWAGRGESCDGSGDIPDENRTDNRRGGFDDWLDLDAGTWVITAKSLYARETGDYTLRVTPR